MSVQDRFPSFVEDQREFFDVLITEEWHTYDSADWDALRRYEIDKLFTLIQPRSVLDIGCGCGFHDLEMARHDFLQTVDAIDYSAESIKRANTTYPDPKVTREVADLTVYEPKRTYDLVVSFQVFEHLVDADAYFRVASAACEPSGSIAIFTPNRMRLPNALRLLRGQKPQLCDPQHFYEYTANELFRLGAAHGFSKAGWFGYGLNGFDWIDRQPMARRLKWGRVLPWLANGICIMMRRPS